MARFFGSAAARLYGTVLFYANGGLSADAEWQAGPQSLPGGKKDRGRLYRPFHTGRKNTDWHLAKSIGKGKDRYYAELLRGRRRFHQIHPDHLPSSKCRL